MKNLQILMPMAGSGSRFRDAGYKTIKPLIEVDGLEMYRKTLSSFDALGYEKRHFFVIQQNHQTEFQLRDNICEKVANAQVIMIDHLTRGAVETCLVARDLLDPQNPLVVLDCDLWFESNDYLSNIEKILHGEISQVGGGLLYFESDNPRYSYAKVEEGFATQTAEKKVISSHALAGAYFFASAAEFIEAADELLNQQISAHMKEYYTSLLYNIILAANYRVTAAKVQKYYSFGTPEELKQYNATSF